MRLLTGLSALLLATAVASAASADRTVTSPGKVIGLARSGYSAAFLAGPYKGHCGPHVELWELAAGGVYRLGRHTDDLCRETPSTGSGVTDLAVAGKRVLWLSYTGGNLRDWSLLTATTTLRTEKKLEFKEVDVDAVPPIVVGVGSESVLPYSVGSTLKVLGANGKLAYTWEAPARVTNATAYSGRAWGRSGQVAVFVEGGRCFVLSGHGVLQQTYSFPRGAVQEFALADVGLIVQLPGGRVEIHKGSEVTKVAIPPQARMLDFAQQLLLYKLGKQIRARRVTTGKDVLLRTGSLAQLEQNGLSYAVGRRVYSVAMVNVLALLNS